LLRLVRPESGRDCLPDWARASAHGRNLSPYGAAVGGYAMHANKDAGGSQDQQVSAEVVSPKNHNCANTHWRSAFPSWALTAPAPQKRSWAHSARPFCLLPFPRSAIQATSKTAALTPSAKSEPGEHNERRGPQDALDQPEYHGNLVCHSDRRPSRSAFAKQIAWPKPASSRPRAASATTTTTHWPRPSTGSTRPS